MLTLPVLSLLEDVPAHLATDVRCTIYCVSSMRANNMSSILYKKLSQQVYLLTLRCTRQNTLNIFVLKVRYFQRRDCAVSRLQGF